MESLHKPKWASHLMETVELDDLFHHCPLSKKDKKEIRKRSWQERGHVEEYEKEEVYFWIGGLVRHWHVFTTFIAYLKACICQPDCCKNNESVIRMTIADCKNLKIKAKLHSGEEMLEKIISMEKNFFPDDKDTSIFRKVQFFYNTFTNCCVSCGDVFDSEECRCCATWRIQMEELFHAENIWYNTGHQNVYMMPEPFYSQDMQQGFRMGLITQWLNGNEWYLAERAAIRHILGCSKRTKDGIPKLLALCVNMITDHYDERKISHLPLPPKMKKQILEDLFSPERHVTNDLLGKYFVWLPPTNELQLMRTRGCYFYTDTKDGVSC